MPALLASSPSACAASTNPCTSIAVHTNGQCYHCEAWVQDDGCKTMGNQQNLSFHACTSVLRPVCPMQQRCIVIGTRKFDCNIDCSSDRRQQWACNRNGSRWANCGPIRSEMRQHSMSNLCVCCSFSWSILGNCCGKEFDCSTRLQHSIATFDCSIRLQHWFCPYMLFG